MDINLDEIKRRIVAENCDDASIHNYFVQGIFATVDALAQELEAAKLMHEIKEELGELIEDSKNIEKSKQALREIYEQIPKSRQTDFDNFFRRQKVNSFLDSMFHTLTKIAKKMEKH